MRWRPASAIAAPTTPAPWCRSGAPRRARPPPAVDHRPVRGGPPADVQRGRDGLDHLQRRDLQPRALRAELEAKGHTLPLAHRHRGDPPPLRGGGTGLRRSAGRHVRVRDLGRAPARAVAGPRPDRRQAAATTRSCPAGSCSARRSRRCSSIPRSQPELDEEAFYHYLTFAFAPPPGPCSRASASSRPAERMIVRRRRHASSASATGRRSRAEVADEVARDVRGGDGEPHARAAARLDRASG